MSIQKPLTAREKAQRKAREERNAKMTPAQKRDSRKKSKPIPTPTQKKKAARSKVFKSAAKRLYQKK